jgi:hypothetical protein
MVRWTRLSLLRFGAAGLDGGLTGGAVSPPESAVPSLGINCVIAERSFLQACPYLRPKRFVERIFLRVATVAHRQDVLLDTLGNRRGASRILRGRCSGVAGRPCARRRPELQLLIEQEAIDLALDREHFCGGRPAAKRPDPSRDHPLPAPVAAHKSLRRIDRRCVLDNRPTALVDRASQSQE